MDWAKNFERKQVGRKLGARLNAQQWAAPVHTTTLPPTDILNGDGIHIHMYRIQMYHVMSCNEIDVYTIVTYTRAGLNARQWILLWIVTSLPSISSIFARSHLRSSRMTLIRRLKETVRICVLYVLLKNNAFVPTFINRVTVWEIKSVSETCLLLYLVHMFLSIWWL